LFSGGVLALFSKGPRERGDHIQAPGIEATGGTVGDADAKVVVGIAEQSVDQGRAAQVGVSPGGVFMGIVGERQIQALRQPCPALDDVIEAQCCVHVIERMDLSVAVAESAGQLDRRRPPAHRLCGVIGKVPQLRKVGIGHGQFPAWIG
jgi:hypothetical protein